MKTYLFDTLNRYKRFSENLDVKAILCNRSWWVFNDIAEKELYIFEEDGTMYVALNGKVNNGNWKYISANKTLIISANEQSVMLHPEFIDDVIFALRLDGTQNCMFLIDENNRDNFIPNTLTELKGYFAEKERKHIACEEEQKEVVIAKIVEQIRLKASDDERRKEMATKERRERELNNVYSELGMFYRREEQGFLGTYFIIVCIIHIIGLLLGELKALLALLSLCFFSIILIIIWCIRFIQNKIRERNKYKRIKTWIESHPNDWRIPYIIEKYNSYHPKHKI